MRRTAAYLWIAWTAIRLQGKTMRGSPASIVLGVIQPMVFLLITAGAERTRSARTGTDLVIGVALTALWGSTIWSAGSILRADLLGGTLIRWLSGARSPAVILLGRCCGAALRTTVVIAGSTAVAAAALGVPVRCAMPGAMLLGLVLTLVSVTALGLLLSCLFLVTRHANAWSAALMYPVFIVSGMIIPLDILPAPVRPLSAAISLRWGERFLTGCAAGAPAWSALAVLAGLSALYLVVALAGFHRLLRRARLDGTVIHG